jgi:lysophospholipase L1-like esterase
MFRHPILLALLAALVLALPAADLRAQTLNASDFRIEWKVANRFRLFSDPSFFALHENAWRQYLLYTDGLDMDAAQRSEFVARTSVLGSEHVLNDRRIAFSEVLRKNFDWRGWAARGDATLCYDAEKRDHRACGGVDAYLNPTGHVIEMWITTAAGVSLPAGRTCEWRIGGTLVAEADCAERVRDPRAVLPYPGGAEISVNVAGEPPIMIDAAVRDLLIAGLGDSFASGEGNPDRPVAFSETRRHRNLYPERADNSVAGSAGWSDELCHRSLYGQQLRAALQIAIENPKASVTFLDYSCSGAGAIDGILGPQVYVARQSDPDNAAAPGAKLLSGGSRDGQLYRLMRELCLDKPEWRKGQVVCPENRFRRSLDFVFLSIGGNDIGFANVVAWATLRDGVSASIAAFFGATVSATDFADRVRDVLPDTYAKLAKAFEVSLPLYSAGDGIFDPSRVVLTAYPDLVTDARGEICPAPRSSDDDELDYPANQSLNLFSSWLTADSARLEAVRQQFAVLYQRMRDLAEDHGWTFAGHVYADGMFEGHGFCARNEARTDDPAELLTIPCWGKPSDNGLACAQRWSGKDGVWVPYNPATQNYPYALRQRWVRSFNDAYMVVNEKVTGRSGKIDERGSEAVFSETTGALHPTAEGHAAMADGLLLSIRPTLQQMLYDGLR